MTFQELLLAIVYFVGGIFLFGSAFTISIVVDREISHMFTVELPYEFYWNAYLGKDGVEREVFRRCRSPKDMIRKMYEEMGIKILSDNAEKKVFEAKLPRGVYYTPDKFTYLHKANDDVLLVFRCDRLFAIRDLSVVPKEYLPQESLYSSDSLTNHERICNYV